MKVSGGEEGKHVRAYVLLVENVDLAIFALRPDKDLVLVPLEHDNIRVPERSATDSGIRIISHIIEAAKHDVVRDDVNQRIGVLSDAARHVVDYTRTLETNLKGARWKELDSQASLLGANTV